MRIENNFFKTNKIESTCESSQVKLPVDEPMYNSTIRYEDRVDPCLTSFFNAIIEKISSFFQWIFSFFSSTKAFFSEKSESGVELSLPGSDLAVQITNDPKIPDVTVYQVYAKGVLTKNKLLVNVKKDFVQIVDFQFTDQKMLKEDLLKLLQLVQVCTEKNVFHIDSLEHAQILWKAGLKPQGKICNDPKIYDPQNRLMLACLIGQLISKAKLKENLLTESGRLALDRIEKAFSKENFIFELADVLALMNDLNEEAVKGISIQAKFNLEPLNT